MKKFAMMIISVCVFSFAANAQDVSTMTTDDREKKAAAYSEALSGLATLKQMAGVEGNADYLGLESGQSLDNATLGAPYPVLILRLDRLLAYDGGDPADTLSKTGQYLFPVAAEGGDVALIRVAPIDGEMKSVEFGLPRVATSLSRTRQMTVADGYVAAEAIMYIEALALNAGFAAYQDASGAIFIASLNENVMGADIPFGQYMRAEDVLRQLQVVAERINPDAPG